MAEVAGKTNLVYVLTGAVAMTNATGAPVLGVDNSTYSKLCTLLEIPSFGDTHMDRIAGLKDSSIDLSGNYYPGDTTGQEELEPGDTIYIGVYPQGTAVAGSQIKGIVEKFDLSADVTGKQTFSASVKGCAAPVALPSRS